VKANCHIQPHYEDHQAVKTMCRWWNTTAPKELQKADLFRVYIWNEKDKYFSPGDPEEPAWAAKYFIATPYALFEKDGLPTVILTFIKGKDSNVYKDFGSESYYVDGQMSMSVGCELNELDESYYTMKGLLQLKRVLNKGL
jgi:hypothetical protein